MKSDKNAKKNRRRDVFSADFRLAKFAANLACLIFSGGFSADKFSAANSAIGGGWGVYPNTRFHSLSYAQFFMHPLGKMSQGKVTRAVKSYVQQMVHMMERNGVESNWGTSLLALSCLRTVNRLVFWQCSPAETSSPVYICRQIIIILSISTGCSSSVEV